MVKANIPLLQSLINAFGVSGSEEEVRSIIRKEIKPYVDEVFVDGIGNLIAVKRGNKPKVMLSAHMDEVGLMVRKIEENGLIYSTIVGDVDIVTAIGQTAHIKTNKGKIHGVITTKEISSGKIQKSMPTIEDLVMDTGFNRKQLKALEAEIGSYIQLEQSSCCLGNNNLIFGKALDNRVGCYVLIELIKRMKKQKVKGNPEIYYVFTVQEEIGLRGAGPSAFTIKPDWGIVVDTTYADDNTQSPSIFIGEGPCITVKDGEFIGNKCINRWLRDIAKKKNIAIQLEAIDEGTTDASTIQTALGGIPTSALCIPIRNLHTTIGIASLLDLESTINLLEELLKNPPLVCLV